MGLSSSYRHPALKQLKQQQARFAPRERRLEQIDRAEQLLAEVHPGQKYPYEYLCFRITGYRPEAAPGWILDGKDAQHDLRRFVEDLSASVSQPPPPDGEPILTIDALTGMAGASLRRAVHSFHIYHIMILIAYVAFGLAMMRETGAVLTVILAFPTAACLLAKCFQWGVVRAGAISEGALFFGFAIRYPYDDSYGFLIFFTLAGLITGSIIGISLNCVMIALKIVSIALHRVSGTLQQRRTGFAAEGEEQEEATEGAAGGLSAGAPPAGAADA